VRPMAKAKKKTFKSFLKSRHTVQFLATLFSNPHLPNFFKAGLYQGKAKALCVPGLNCYSCPAATGSCPIGSFQAVVGSSKFRFSYYVTGILIFLGMVLGRFICGFLCPFGWFQELLHKIPGKKFSTKKLKPLRYVKYLVLALAVVVLPIFLVNGAGLSFPYFCKYICPQGVLEGGIPLAIINPDIRRALGPLFAWKTVVLAAVVVLSILFYRPFCKWLCPLGAFYALFNKVSFLHYKVDDDKCIRCGKCSRVCQMDVDITRDSGHPECIRCGDCKRACPTQAISVHWGLDKGPKPVKKCPDTFGPAEKTGEIHDESST
jgi:ferredoxin-type protein NapH